MDKPKGAIKAFNSQLTEEQKLAKARILENTITVLKGKAGSSKTYLACNIALDLLARKDNNIKKIFVSRPFVYPKGEEDLGILPGTVREKLVGMMTPIIQNMYDLTSKEYIERLIEDDTISILPTAFMQGMTINDAVFILDEFQNASLLTTYMALSRIGKGTKVIVTGDPAQCTLKSKTESGFDFFKKLEIEQLPGFEIIELKSNYRHDLVDKINTIYHSFKD